MYIKMKTYITWQRMKKKYMNLLWSNYTLQLTTLFGIGYS